MSDSTTKTKKISKTERFFQFLDQAHKNISQDRETSDHLLTLINDELTAVHKSNQSRIVAELAQAGAKCIESNQRSNEQLVKLSQMLAKDVEDDDGKLSESDIKELQEEIKNDE